MTILSLAALVLSFLSIGIHRGRLTTPRIGSFILLLCLHVGLTLYYCEWSRTVAADAFGYYYGGRSYVAGPWAFGSTFVFKFVDLLKVQFGATYLDCFMIFQSFGFAALMFLARVFDEVEESFGLPWTGNYNVLLFMPSINFWTSAIGKDAPLFFAVSLCLWSKLRFSSRWIFFGLGLAIMVLFRAHVAMLTMLAFAASTAIGSNTSTGRKIGILPLALAGVWLTAGAVQNTFHVDATSASSVSEFLEKKTSDFAADTGATSIGHASFAVKLLSLLYRPFFFDAGNALGLVASVENIGAILATILIIRCRRDIMFLTRKIDFIGFSAVYAVFLITLLSLIYYNVGLGLRERVMCYPMIFALLVALWSLRRKRSLLAKESLAPGLPLAQKRKPTFAQI